MKIKTSIYGEPNKKFQLGIKGAIETPFTGIKFLEEEHGGIRTIEKIASEEFNSIIESVEKHGEISSMEIFTTVHQLKNVETKFKKKLEDLALEVVSKNFGLPDDVKKMLNVNLDHGSESESLHMDRDPNELEIKSLREKLSKEEIIIAEKLIHKRKIQNALIMGSGYRAHKLFKGFQESIDLIHPNLYPAYQKFLPSVELFLWKFEIPVNSRVVWGKCHITLNEEESRLQGNAISKLFIILLHETAKIATEILFLQSVEDIYEKHGKNMKSYVLAMSDRYEDEQWMKLIGPRIWKYFHDAIDYLVKEHDDDYRVVSILINQVGLLEPDKFLSLISDVINSADKALPRLEELLKKASSQVEYFDKCKTEDSSKVMQDDFAQMSREHLLEELKKAVEMDDFEKAIEIKKKLDS